MTENSSVECPTSEVKSSEETRALVPVTKQEVRTLVVSAIRGALADASQKSIGVSTSWLVKQAEDFRLKEEEVYTLVTIRTNFGGKLTHAVKFLDHGMSVDEVYNLYRVQRELANLGDKQFNVSLGKLSRLARTFSEADLDNEGLFEIIIEAHAVISDNYHWVKFVSHTIDMLCAIAETHGCGTIEGALAMVDTRGAIGKGFLPSDNGGISDNHY